jgi:hypothetical protein
MRRRTIIVLSLTAAMLVLIGILLSLIPGSDVINASNFRRIELGMTAAEMEAILGPPGYHYDGPTKFLGDDVLGDVPASLRWPEDTVRWTGSEGRVVAFFDDGGRLTGAYFEKREPLPELLLAQLDRLRRRLF